MRKKRGQAAMEFLMTYGWALLAIIIIGGLIWIYIGGRECGRVSTGFLGQNIAIQDWTETDLGVLRLSIGNRAPDDVWILSITGSGGTDNIADTLIAKGGDPVSITTVASTGSTGTAGNCYSEDTLTVQYNVTGGTEHTVTGRISGSYES